MAAFQHDLFALFEQALHKRCCSCRETKPLALFSRSRCEKGGLKRECKACCKVMRKRHYDQNREKAIADATAYQLAHPEKAREWNRKAQAKGRDRYNAQKRSRYHANKAAIRAGFKLRYHHDPEFRAKILVGAAERRRMKGSELNAASREWRKANKAKVRAFWKAWALKNPDAARVAAVLGQQRRRARVRNMPDKFDKATWRNVLHYYGHRCAYCLQEADPLTVDHLMPISRYGTNEEANLAPACGPCNSSKGDRTPLEYLAGIRLT